MFNNNSMNILETEFKNIIINIKKDVLKTQYTIMSNANVELINLYYRLGKIIYENTKYGNNFIERLSQNLKIEFPNMTGFSKRNLSRMKTFYKEYKEYTKLPTPLAKLPWSHNYLLIEKLNNINIRIWYAKKCYENGWSYSVLNHQICLKLYERQAIPPKLNNFSKNLPKNQSELANEILKDPYIFELENITEKIKEKDIENAMIEKLKNVLLELGKGFSFVGNQYKINTNNHDYYIDMLFYHLELRCYIVVELKTIEFKPEYIGQLSFYITAIDETIKKETDNPTIGLLLCKNKDKISVEWSLKNINVPIGVSTYHIKNNNYKNILKYLPTEKDINLHLDLK